MAEVIQPLSLEVVALAASQQQQQLTLETLQFKLTEQEEATKKALLEASESKAAALRAAQEQHRQASIAALDPAAGAAALTAPHRGTDSSRPPHPSLTQAPTSREA